MKKNVVVWKIVGALRGGSGSVLAICNEGLYVVKCPANPQGPAALANEFLGTELMKAIGLPVPAWSPAFYSSMARCPICNEGSGDRRTRDSLPHFASRLISTKINRELSSPLPLRFIPRVRNRADFVGALVFDIWAGSCDARQVAYAAVEGSDAVDATFIDNGHLFGGPNWDFKAYSPARVICSDLAIYPNPIDPMSVHGWVERIQNVVPHLLPAFMAQVPKEWKPRGEIRHVKVLTQRLRDLEKSTWSAISLIQPSTVPPVHKTPEHSPRARVDLPRRLESASLLAGLQLRQNLQ